MPLEISQLTNGLRIITDHVAEMDSVAIGIWVDVGTRHENMTHNGVAHMVEHMMFKGTNTLNAQQISEKVEDRGGNMNAYTSRENTAYFIRMLKEDYDFGLEILSDMVLNSTFPEEEVEKERDVILQEIGMTLDTPDDIVFDLYQETAYPGQALGAPILGRAEIIQSMQRDVMKDYVRRFYTPSRLIISCAGGVAHRDVVKKCESLFSTMTPVTREAFDPAAYCGGEHRHGKDLEQSHVVLGFQGLERNDPDYHAAMILSVIMGGGMSSRLFQEVREKRGLVYSVFSAHTGFHDDGQFELYAGTGPDKLPELIPVLTDEIQKLVQDGVRSEELKRAKTQVKASLLMGRESMFSRANKQAKSMIYFNRMIETDEQVLAIEAVDQDVILKTARRIFSGKPTLAAIGPLEKLESYDQISQRLVA